MASRGEPYRPIAEYLPNPMRPSCTYTIMFARRGGVQQNRQGTGRQLLVKYVIATNGPFYPKSTCRPQNR